jgi:hypothetical protein
MSDSDLTGELAELRELVAGTAAETARVAAEVVKIATAFTSAEWMSKVMALAREDGYRERLAEADTHQATARAQQRRAELRAVPGRKDARRGGAG